MLMKDKKSGDVVGMHYDVAQAALGAGTHEVVNEPADPTQPPAGPEALASAPTNPVAPLDPADPAQRGVPIPVEEATERQPKPAAKGKA